MAHDAVRRAMQRAERFREKASGAGGGDPRQVLSAPGGALPWGMAQRGERFEELRHFKGWQYCAITAIANRIAGQEILVARAPGRPNIGKSFRDSLTPLQTHPMLDALIEPNPLMVAWQLVYMTVCCLELAGEAYWWFPRPDAGGKQQIWCLPPSWIWPTDIMRTSYMIRPTFNAEGVEVDAKRIAYFSLPNPGEPFVAHSPLQSQSAAVEADEQLQICQARSYMNGLMPKLAIIAGDPLSDDPDKRPTLENSQREVILNALRKMHQGSARFGGALILDNVIRDVKFLTNKPLEMDFAASGQATKSRILQAWQVSPAILGELENSNRAAAVVANKTFNAGVINPLLTMMSQVLTRWACPVFARSGERLVAWFEPARAED